MNPNGSFMSWKEALHRDFPCGHRMEKKRRRFYAVDCTLSAYARHAALAPPVGRLVPAPALGTGGKEIRRAHACGRH